MSKKFITCCKGATAIEYGLICGLIFLAIIGSIALLGDGSTGLFGGTSTAVEAAMK